MGALQEVDCGAAPTDLPCANDMANNRGEVQSERGVSDRLGWIREPIGGVAQKQQLTAAF